MYEPTTQQHRALADAQLSIADRVPQAYPWSGLEQELDRRSRDSLTVLAYGSLLHRDSALVTLSEAAFATRRPAVAFGTRRVFEYVIPADNPRYEPTPVPDAVAALNVRITGQLTDMTNGIALDLPRPDLEAFRGREVGYDLVLVPCLDWADSVRGPFFAHILSCPGTDGPEGCRTRDGIMPHPDYYRICREGAAVLGDDFLQLWLRTTYLADAETSAAAWEDGLPDG